MLKIDENSLQNSIIKDGQMVIGQVGEDSCIYTESIGSIAVGYVTSNSAISVKNGNGFAGGYAENNGRIEADIHGAHAEGYVENNSYIKASGNGTYATGYCYGSLNSYQSARIEIYDSVAAHNVNFTINRISGNIVNLDIIYQEQVASFNSKIFTLFEDLIDTGKYIAPGQKDNDRRYWWKVTGGPNISSHEEGSGFYSSNVSINVTGDIIQETVHNDYLYVITNTNYYNSSIIASEDGAHAEGYVNKGSIIAEGKGSYAEGYVTSNGSIISEGFGSYASGCAINGGYIDASGRGAHAEGYAWYSSAASEPRPIIADGNGAHAEGQATQAIGVSAHAEGTECFALHNYSHAGGLSSKTDTSCQTVIGKYNANTNGEGLFVVGNGNDSARRSNAFVVYENGSYRANSIVNLNIIKNSEYYDKENYTYSPGMLEHTKCFKIKKYANKLKFNYSSGDSYNSYTQYMYFDPNIYKEGDEIILFNNQLSSSISYSLSIFGCYNTIQSNDTSIYSLEGGKAVKILFTGLTDTSTHTTIAIQGSTVTISYTFRTFVYQNYEGFVNVLSVLDSTPGGEIEIAR